MALPETLGLIPADQIRLRVERYVPASYARPLYTRESDHVSYDQPAHSRSLELPVDAQLRKLERSDRRVTQLRPALPPAERERIHAHGRERGEMVVEVILVRDRYLRLLIGPSVFVQELRLLVAAAVEPGFGRGRKYADEYVAAPDLPVCMSRLRFGRSKRTSGPISRPAR